MRDLAIQHPFCVGDSTTGTCGFANYSIAFCVCFMIFSSFLLNGLIVSVMLDQFEDVRSRLLAMLLCCSVSLCGLTSLLFSLRAGGRRTPHDVGVTHSARRPSGKLVSSHNWCLFLAVFLLPCCFCPSFLCCDRNWRTCGRESRSTIRWTYTSCKISSSGCQARSANPRISRGPASWSV